MIGFEFGLPCAASPFVDIGVRFDVETCINVVCGDKVVPAEVDTVSMDGFVFEVTCVTKGGMKLVIDGATEKD